MLEVINMKKLIIILITLLFLLSCSDNTLKIGFTAGLTGILAEEGVSTRNGFILAVEEINDNGGINGKLIEGVIKDDASNLENGYEINQSFDEENINLIVGYFLSSMEPAVREGMDTYNHLYVSPTMATANLSGEDDHFYRVIGDNHLMAKDIYDLIQESNTNRILIVQNTANRALTEVLKEDLIKFLTKDNAPLVGLYEIEETIDYGDIIQNIKSSNAEGVVILTGSIQASELLQRMQLEGLETTNFVSTWALSAELISKAGTAAEGLYGVGFYDANTTDPHVVEFIVKYENRFNQTPTSTSILAYDAVYLLKEAIQQAGSTKVQKVKEALDEIESFHGVTGPFELNNTGDAIRPYEKLIILEGQLRSVN